MSAQDYGWGSPGCTRDRLTRVQTPGMIDSAPYFPLYVRADVAPLFAELCRWLVVERNRHGLPPLTCSGGYNLRPVRGYEVRYDLTKDPRYLSNHSWGTAGDFSVATNPMQDTLRTDMPPGTAEKAASLGMRWGGTYTGRKDPQHFEVIVGPAEVARIVAALNQPAPVEDTVSPEDKADIINGVTANLLAKIQPEGGASIGDELDRLRRTVRALAEKAGVTVENGA